jgi:hypothetical protein
MAERLVAEHVDDGDGRCRGCPIGAQHGYHSWPCTIISSVRRAVAARQTMSIDPYGTSPP